MGSSTGHYLPKNLLDSQRSSKKRIALHTAPQWNTSNAAYTRAILIPTTTPNNVAHYHNRRYHQHQQHNCLQCQQHDCRLRPHPNYRLRPHHNYRQRPHHNCRLRPHHNYRQRPHHDYQLHQHHNYRLRPHHN
ncbi:hypothetical protein ElyMa_003464700 [Elysia marginata]|uniref:Uncharacterized protein n=1 Tax=Elysia marginata TaxID=1093978 RepID=A0AAV4EAP9_9GAST|nr:hypothetical protein ElyMa_003464700 [Elysia marginata]